ncbi:PAS domain-containing protein [Methylobacterium sp. PvR107]|uniref:PAS domain-containing protein n=1 Tax=Methylobacterium sp. PvR107 TaxID=2806597 RepID=UPI001AE9F57C|nr:PAS domain-containing protein [Methylobacterium sp. PvR107]MBP1180057.1 signal transduction histidine kinase [Methylobacterium sp. PvR107]
MPNLATSITARDPVHLVIDAGAGRIVYASANARLLADALGGPGLAGLIRQIAASAPKDAAPRLVRLRLDPRRIAPPVLCWLARHDHGSGGSVILVAPTAPVAMPRLRATQPEAESSPQRPPEAAAPEPTLRRDDRFLWRMDESGTLTALNGPDLLAGLVGQQWQDLAAAGRITGAEGMLAALRERRTFRGEPAVLETTGGPVRVELSGAPLGRGDAAFSGFGGFGLIRSLPRHTSGPVPQDTAAKTARPVEVAPITPAPAAPPPYEPQSVDVADPAPVPASLSTDEHAAFREIARALGARYAGDEAGPDTRERKPESGAIMPFPGSQTGLPETRDAAAAPVPGTEILAGLPLPALIHRADAILAANGRFLELTGYADLAALAATGLDALLPGYAPADKPAARRAAVVTTAGGSTQPVEALSGACTWAGAPATCLIVRPLEEADVAGALTAERLAHAAQAERTASAEAALDALPSGLVTVDGAGRVVTVNRAAAALLGCDPREVVGGSFVALFDRDSVLTVADLLRSKSAGSHPVSLAGAPVILDIRRTRDDDRRVAVLDPAPQAPPAPPPIAEDRVTAIGGSRRAALARLDQAFREPLTGMLDLADAMLKEPFGPLGDARYRGCLAEIKASGEAMLQRVGKLLDLAAVEAGSLQLEPRPLDLNDVAAGCVARLQGEAARGRIVVRTSFSSDLEDLEADERSVSRAASLVIEHAIRRSTAGGQIIVSTGAAERTAVALRVRDTGAAAARAADPEGDVEEGLALPRALVEANGGRLQLSARPEDGTLVEIIMPIRRAANG